MKLSRDIIDFLSVDFIRRKGNSTIAGVLRPAQTDTYDLGSAGRRFDTVYARTVVADTFTGEVSGNADTVDNFHASAAPTANTLLALDANSVFPDSVYPNALLIDGSRALAGNLPVNPGVTIDGVDIDVFKLDFDTHVASTGNPHYVTLEQARSAGNTVLNYIGIDPATATAPFVLGTNAQGQLVTGLNADQLDGYHATDFVPVTTSIIAGDGLTGGGALSGDVTIGVGQGAGITVSANAVAVDTGFDFEWSGGHDFFEPVRFSSNASHGDVHVGEYLRIVADNGTWIEFGSAGGHPEWIHSHASSGRMYMGYSLAVNGAIQSTMLSVHTMWSSGYPGSGNVRITNKLALQNAIGLITSTARFSIDDSSNYDYSIKTGKGRVYFGDNVDIAYDGNNYTRLSTDNGGDLTITPTGGSVLLGNATINSANWVSGSTGWGIQYDGTADFRDLYADSFHVTTLVSDVQRVEDGTILLGKSLGVVAQDFVIPAVGSTVAVMVYDNPASPATALFAQNDILVVRYFTSISGGWHYFKVSSAYTDNGDGTQSWTLTSQSGSGEGATVYESSTLFDIGVANTDGYIKLTATESGAPYMDIAVQDGSITASPFVRLGKLSGIAVAAGDYGLWTGDGTTSADAWLEAGDNGITLNNAALTITDGTDDLIVLDNSAPYLSIGNPAPAAWGQDGIWMGIISGAPKFRIGTVSTRLEWNGTDIRILGTNLNYSVWNSNSFYVYSEGASVVQILGGSTPQQIIGATSGSHIRLSATNGFVIMDGGTKKGQWQTDGDIFIGSDISSPATTYFSIFANDQNYNGEDVYAGDMLIGDNSANQANLFWDKSAGQLLFRGGTTKQLWLDTDGSLVAGGGTIWLDDDGLSINALGYQDSSSSLKWMMGSTALASIWTQYSASTGVISSSFLVDGLNDNDWTDTEVRLFQKALAKGSDGLAEIYLYVQAYNSSSSNSSLILSRAWADSIGTATFNELNVLIDGGLHIGGTSDPGVNNLVVDGYGTFGNTVKVTSGYIEFYNASDSILRMTATPDDGHIFHADTGGTSRLYLNWYGGSSTATKEVAVGNGNQTWGNILADNFYNQSTIRSKADIVPIEQHLKEPALSKVSKLRPVAYTSVNDNHKTQRLGLIAEELADVIPEAVAYDQQTGEVWGINLSAVIPVLVKSIQELRAEVAALRSGKEKAIGVVESVKTTEKRSKVNED